MQNNLETLQLFNVRTYQKTLTSFVEDFPVKHFQSQDYEKALMIQEVRYFLKLHGFSDITKSVETQSTILYSKMLKVYLATKMDEHLLLSTEFLPTLVIPLSANCLILAGFSPKIESGFTLSDILEENVDQKYFLSEKQKERIERVQKGVLLEL